MPDFNNDLLIKDNPADLVVHVIVVDYDGNERRVTILLDSSDDWSPPVESKEIAASIGFFGAAIFRAIQDDLTVKIFYVEAFQIINGTTQDFCKLRPFVRDGTRFRRAAIHKDGTIDFLPEDEI